MSEYNFNKIEGESTLLQLIRISVDKLNGLHNASWEEIYAMFELDYSCYTLRRYAPAWKLLIDNRDAEGINEILEGQKYKESFEIKADGTQTSDKLIVINGTQEKTPEFMLKAHGFDPEEWELVNSRNNVWNTNDKRNGVQVLYSSKITVKPKSNGFDFNKLIERLKKEIKPSTTRYASDGSMLLVIPFVDMHFGINDFDYYREKLEETIYVIKSRKWDAIYIPIGNDLLHNNDFKGKTANGTPIEKVDTVKAWDDAYKFYCRIYEEAITNSTIVISDYIAGNHDADMAWGLARGLEIKFPQVKWDTSIKNKKYLRWNDIFLINLHGEKGINRVAKTLITKYRDFMVGAKTVEIHSGHLHAQKVLDEYGILIRTLPTSAKEDEWHEEQSFEGSVKTSQLFAYNKEKLKAIYHV